jgi:hypothetical protein
MTHPTTMLSRQPENTAANQRTTWPCTSSSTPASSTWLISGTGLYGTIPRAYSCWKRFFGTTLTLSTGRVLPVRFIGEQHVLEDLGRIPTVADWLARIQPESWMLGRGQSLNE